MKRGGHRVNIKEAVEKRILELCREKNIAINTLANISGMPPSTIYSMLNEKSQNPGIVSIKKICDGLDIGIREFFDSELFDNLEQEIK
jgi:transcriptional regulator with XRE-family HTH domain